MAAPWIANYLGFKLSEENMEHIPHPTTELVIHVCIKTGIVWGAVGTAIGPLLAYYKGKTDPQSLRDYTETCGRNGVIAGTIAGPIITGIALGKANATRDSIVDRCYRIRYNNNQLRIDRIAFLGTLAGYGAAKYLGEKLELGSLVGMTSGWALAMFMNYGLGV